MCVKWQWETFISTHLYFENLFSKMLCRYKSLSAQCQQQLKNNIFKFKTIFSVIRLYVHFMYTCESVGCSIFGLFFAHRYWLWPHHLHHCLYLGCCILNKHCLLNSFIVPYSYYRSIRAIIISCRICDVITYMLTSSGSGQEPPIVASSYRTPIPCVLTSHM